MEKNEILKIDSIIFILIGNRSDIQNIYVGNLG